VVPWIFVEDSIRDGCAFEAALSSPLPMNASADPVIVLRHSFSILREMALRDISCATVDGIFFMILSY